VARPTYERREDIELTLLACDLEERQQTLAFREQHHAKAMVEWRVELWLFMLATVLTTMASTAASIYYALHGGVWPVLLAPGAVPVLSYVIGRQRRQSRHMDPSDDLIRLTATSS
jgi:hypothetical protein